MTRPTFPDRVNNERLEQRSFPEIDRDSDSDPFARKLAIGMFISAVLASSGFIIYLFDLIGTTPKVSPTSPPIPSALQSASVRIVES